MGVGNSATALPGDSGTEEEIATQPEASASFEEPFERPLAKLLAQPTTRGVCSSSNSFYYPTYYIFTYLLYFVPLRFQAKEHLPILRRPNHLNLEGLSSCITGILF